MDYEDEYGDLGGFDPHGFSEKKTRVIHQEFYNGILFCPSLA